MKGKLSLFHNVNYRPISGDISYMGNGDRSGFSKYISNRADIDLNNTLDVIAHGDFYAMEYNKFNKLYVLSAREFAKIIKRDPQYKSAKSIRLFSCNTGSKENGFAQHLANALGKPVYAPNNYIWSYPNGKHFICGRDKYGKPDYSVMGEFKIFVPGGIKNGK